MRAHAFTLIEVLVVIVLVAVMATIAAVSLSGAAEVSSVQESIDVIKHLDRTTRERAERTGEPWRLVLDLDKATMELRGTTVEKASVPIVFGQTAAPKALWLKIKPITSGKAVIAFQPNGVSPDYAVVIQDRAGVNHSVLFIGATGEAKEFDHDKALSPYFEMRQAPWRDDAD